MLPLMIGITQMSGRENLSIMQDSFGLISIVAMMPLIIIQIVGLIYNIKINSKTYKDRNEIFEDDDIIIFPRNINAESK